MTTKGASKVTVVPWEADAYGRVFTYVGPRADDLLGYPKEEWYQIDFWMKHIHPEDREGAHAFCEAAAASGMGYELEYRMIGSEGQVVWLRDVVHVVRDDQGKCFLQGFKIDITETRRAQETQRHIHQEQQIIFHSVPAMIWYKDGNNKILRCNKLAAESRGLTAEDIEGHFTEEFYPDEAAKYLADDQEVIRTGEPKLGIIEPYEIATGEKRWVRTDKIPYRDENDQIVGVIVFATDVTNLKQQEDHLNLALLSTRAFVWQATITRERDHYAWEFFLPNESQAQRVLPLNVPAGSTYMQEWQRHRTSETQRAWEHRCNHALQDGQKKVQVESCYENIRNNTQRVEESIYLSEFAPDRWIAVGVNADKTDEYKKDEQMRLSEQRLKIISSTAVDAAGILSPTGRILSCNAAFATLAGYATENEALFQNAADAFSSAIIFDEFVTKIRKEKRVDYPDFAWTRRPNTPLQIRLKAEGLFDSAGQLAEIFVSAAEQGKAKASEEQTVETQQWETIGRLTGGIAHDFNNLLTSILGFGRIILDKTDINDPIHKDVERIVSAGERAASLTRQILSLGRKKIAAPRSLNINAVVSDMDHLLRRTLGADIELVTLLAEDLPSMVGVPGLLERIVAELALLARKRLTHGGKLVMQTAQTPVADIKKDPYLTLTVKAFDEGNQDIALLANVSGADETAVRTVHHLVQQMGGMFMPEGIMYFPCNMPAKETYSSTLSDTLPHGTETILIVEDENMVRDLTSRMLSSLGYRVIEARNGEDGLSVIAAHTENIDMILSDVVMPQMSGPAMMEKLVAMGKKYKVLFMSGYNEEEMFKNASLDGTAQLLPKPFTRKSLAYRIRKILDQT